MHSDTTRILVLGASGMLGHAVLRYFGTCPEYEVWGSARSGSILKSVSSGLHERILTGIDVERPDQLMALFDQVRPQVVVNCIGLVKQLAAAQDPISALSINAILPHRLLRLTSLIGARLIHVSTDCVFSGATGMYPEEFTPDADDLYGRSKLLGEVDAPHAITLRTSIIGPELDSAHGLVGWFLGQHNSVRGYRRAIFSGLPTVELARVIHQNVLPHPELHGLFHVSAAAISKFDLLALISKVYNKSIRIEPDDTVVIDRSLDSSRFRQLAGYEPPSWDDLVRRMCNFG